MGAKMTFIHYDLLSRKSFHGFPFISLISIHIIPNSFNIVKTEIVKKLGIQKHWSVLPKSREYLLQYEPKNIADLPPRSMQDSFTSALIPLSSDEVIRDKYVTFLGSVRLGRLMEDMDLFAVWVVHQHVKIPTLSPTLPLPYTFVTLLVDSINFTNTTPKVLTFPYERCLLSDLIFF